MKVLITCPPMIGMQDQFLPVLAEYGVEADCPQVVQALSEQDLIRMLPAYDGWIIGDDPATRQVFEAGRAGRLKAAVKWGVGTDNVDFDACAALDIAVDNTPGMFGDEVADIALGYLIGLARETYAVDRAVRDGRWPKPRGMSLKGKTVGLIGYGDVGRSAGARFRALGMNVVAWVPENTGVEDGVVVFERWPGGIDRCDFLVLACPLTRTNRHMLDGAMLARTKRGVRIVNVARGGLIDEQALLEALDGGQVHSAALDVYELEPPPCDSRLRHHDRCILGSHNASNTADAVARTNLLAIEKLMTFLGRGRS